MKTKIQALEEQQKGMKKIQCTLCDENFEETSTFENHLKNNHDFGKLTPLQNNLARKESENKKLEAKIRTTLRAFKCDECAHQATSTKDLTTHLRSLHNYGNLAHQDKLETELKTARKAEADLKSHLTKALQCSVCDLVLHSKKDLNNHSEKHMNDAKKQYKQKIFDLEKQLSAASDTKVNLEKFIELEKSKHQNEIDDAQKQYKENIVDLEKRLTATSDTNVCLEKSVTEHQKEIASKNKELDDLALFF